MAIIEKERSAAASVAVQQVVKERDHTIQAFRTLQQTSSSAVKVLQGQLEGARLELQRLREERSRALAERADEQRRASGSGSVQALQCQVESTRIEAQRLKEERDQAQQAKAVAESRTEYLLQKLMSTPAPGGSNVRLAPHLTDSKPQVGVTRYDATTQTEDPPIALTELALHHEAALAQVRILRAERDQAVSEKAALEYEKATQKPEPFVKEEPDLSPAFPPQPSAEIVAEVNALRDEITRLRHVCMQFEARNLEYQNHNAAQHQQIAALQGANQEWSRACGAERQKNEVLMQQMSRMQAQFQAQIRRSSGLSRP